MLWQGVALLPFINEHRLLEAMVPGYEKLSEKERKRNKWGNNATFVVEEHPLYPTMEALYGIRKNDEVSLLMASYIFGAKVYVPSSLFRSTRNTAKASLAAYFRTQIAYLDRLIYLP